MTQRKANFIITLIAMAWGMSFMFMHLGLAGLEPFNIIALRFLIAFAVMLLLFGHRLIKVDRTTLKCAALGGSLLFCIFSCILLGMATTNASTSSFLVNASVVFVPLIKAALRGKLPNRNVTAAMLLSVSGIFLVAGNTGFQIDHSTWLVLSGALLNAVFIVVTDKISRQADSFQLGVYQLGIAGMLGLIASLIFEQPTLPQTPMHWLAILGLALICSAFGFVMQPIAQKHTTPEHTGFLLGMESVYASAFAFIFLGERFTARGYLGAGLVLASVFVSSRSQSHKCEKTSAVVETSSSTNREGG